MISNPLIIPIIFHNRMLMIFIKNNMSTNLRKYLKQIIALQSNANGSFQKKYLRPLNNCTRLQPLYNPMQMDPSRKNLLDPIITIEGRFLVPIESIQLLHPTPIKVYTIVFTLTNLSSLINPLMHTHNQLVSNSQPFVSHLVGNCFN